MPVYTIQQTFKHFLELPLVFDSTCSYISALKNTETIVNIIQGSCFSSNYFCRFCRCNKHEASSYTCENVNLQRTRENYDNDLYSRSFGIREECVWHTLPNFNLTQNSTCDIMHDLLEGVCSYDLKM